jgi:peptide deformylase
MSLTLCLYGNPILRKKGRPIDTITPEIRQLAEDMIETMHASEGIGLAAQQIGKDLQLTVIDLPDTADHGSRMWIDNQPVTIADFMPMVLINPELKTIKKKDTATEGCLSFPGISVDVRRSSRVEVQALNLEGEPLHFDADGLLGRCIQHEVDHLNGILFIDHADPETRRSIKPALEELRAQGRAQ